MNTVLPGDTILPEDAFMPGDALETLDMRETRRGLLVSRGIYQDCGELARRCTAARNADSLQGHRKPRAFRLVAEIPVALAEVLKAQGIDIMNDKKALRQVLNDPAFRVFRTTTGRV